ncbi:MAG TPA: response regulator transcription factor [Chitinophagaceae bacterium]|nr:response regulator transcription factor [Chitinophagaceae bacterium]
MEKEMIRILLADDHEIIRSGLKLFISNLIAHCVIDEAWDGNSTLGKVKENDYHLVIMDLNMPGTNSFELIENIVAVKPAASVLIFSINPEEVHAKRYLQLGAKGYVNKNAPVSELGEAINTVLKNKRYLSPSLSHGATEQILNGKTINPFDNLSAREFEVVQHLIKGESLSGICHEINLKASTVSTYKARIFEKLNCKNTMEVIQLAKIYNIFPAIE